MALEWVVNHHQEDRNLRGEQRSMESPETKLADARPGFEMAYMTYPAGLRLALHLVAVVSFLVAASLRFSSLLISFPLVVIMVGRFPSPKVLHLAGRFQ